MYNRGKWRVHSEVSCHGEDTLSGPLKPPFNEVARKAAGFGPQWYEPLATKESAPDHKIIVNWL